MKRLACLLALAFLSSTVALDSDGSASPAMPTEMYPVTLSYTKDSDNVLDGDQEGSVEVIITGPANANLAAKSYDFPVLGEDTLTWSWTPPTYGNYTVLFDDTPLDGMERDETVQLVVASVELNDANDGEAYFAYGDSITAAIHPIGEMPSDGSASWVQQMQDAHVPGARSDHNRDGSGMGTQWAIDNLAAYYPGSNPMQEFVVMFGVNDLREGYAGAIPKEQTAANLLSLWNLTHGTGAQASIGLGPVVGESEFYTFTPNGTDMAAWFDYITTRLLEYDVRIIPAYDALDAVPWNGQADDVGTANLGSDDIHYDEEGQRLLGEFMWFFINHEDQTHTWDEATETLQVDAHYSQTIIVPIRSEWNPDNLVVVNLGTNQVVGHEAGYTNTIQFSAQDGESYRVQDTPHATDGSSTTPPSGGGTVASSPSVFTPIVYGGAILVALGLLYTLVGGRP